MTMSAQQDDHWDDFLYIDPSDETKVPTLEFHDEEPLSLDEDASMNTPLWHVRHLGWRVWAALFALALVTFCLAYRLAGGWG